jgi:hypothetical protein
MIIKPNHERTPEILRKLAERASLELDHARRFELSQQFDNVLAQDEGSQKPNRSNSIPPKVL